MRYPKIPNSLFIKNRKKLMSMIPDHACAVLNSNDEMPRNGDQFFRYRQNSDFFYLTGIEQEKSILVLIPDGLVNEREYLFIMKADKKQEIWEGHKLTKQMATDISGIPNIKYLEEFDFFLRETALKYDFIYLNDNEYLKFSSSVPYKDLRFITDMKERYPLHKFERLAPKLTELRTVKEPEEIELIRKACDLTTQAFNRVLKFIRPGVKEYEIEAEITHEFIRNGAVDHAYHPIIASGKDNCILHYNKNDKVCHVGELVLMDFGAEYAGYSADTTRTVPVSGKFSPRQLEVYHSVLNVLKQAEKLYVVGATITSVNREIEKWIELELVTLKLAKPKDFENAANATKARMKYYMHGAAHFMGLDVHDVGSKDTPFKPGMVLTCEPGIYIEEEGIGVRLENDILVAEHGPVNLFAAEPIEPDEIERLMKK